MITNEEEPPRAIGNRSLDDDKVQRILDYIQGAVYCWCNTYKDEEFAAYNLFGEENRNWEGTPLLEIYNNRLNKNDPVREAGIDCGHFLRRVLRKDERNFELTDTTRPGQHYKWMRV